MAGTDKYHRYHRLMALALGWFLGGMVLPLPGQSDTLVPFPIEQQIEADFLFHYYEQDGNHSAVTGGLGTEYLTDLGGQLQLMVPLDSQARLEVATTLNHYTSASTDRIDSYLSSASRKDNRAALQLGLAKEKGQITWSGGVGGSFESDYLSTSLYGGWRWQSPDRLRALSIQSHLYLDTWVVIYPEELRAPGLASVPTNKRRTWQLGAVWTQPLHPRLRFSLHLESVVQQGLLSTPFHRVYFHPDSLPSIEQLPPWRWRIPVAMRSHYFATNWLVIRGMYRWYWDSFSIQSHTVHLEPVWKISPFLSLYPFYRFHWQSGSTWFVPYAAQDRSAPYFTSDFDLSGFTSQSYGAGFSATPVYGLARWRLSPIRTARWDRVELRYARYVRSDGLNSHAISLGLGFLL